MAELRITPGSQLPSVTSAPSPVRSEAVKAAQRAFFQAALNQAQQGDVRAPAPASRTSAPAPPAGDERPSRLMRPGSVLDIKV